MHAEGIGLACRDLTFVRTGRRSGAVKILDQVNADFESGNLTLITGPAGSGKSTLLHLMAGLLRPTSGEIWAGDQPVSRWKPLHLDRWRRQVGIVFQHLHLISGRSALENLLVRLMPLGGSLRGMHRAALEALEQVDLLDLAAAPVRTLSGGQRQRVAVARALLGNPKYLLLDEPTTFQDDAGAADLMLAFSAAARKDACVVVCTHDVRLAAGSSASVRCMNLGRLGSLP